MTFLVNGRRGRIFLYIESVKKWQEPHKTQILQTNKTSVREWWYHVIVSIIDKSKYGCDRRIKIDRSM